MLHSQMLRDTLQVKRGERLLVLNSALTPFVEDSFRAGMQVTLAEDNIAAVQALEKRVQRRIDHFAFHDYILILHYHSQEGRMDVAILDLLYQPANAWMFYAIQLAFYALREGGKLYVVGGKDRGILSVGKRMQERFGNLGTLEIRKGARVLCSIKSVQRLSEEDLRQLRVPLQVFAGSQLDEGTKLLLEEIEVGEEDEILDIGCGAGFIGLELARRAPRGRVTMVDASLAAVATSEQRLAREGLQNVRILASDGAQAVLGERFDLIASNPPFHQGGIQTLEIATKFISQAAQVVKSEGRFYLVANRFLKYEPILSGYFREVLEVGGNTRYKVLRARRAQTEG